MKIIEFQEWALTDKSSVLCGDLMVIEFENGSRIETIPAKDVKRGRRAEHTLINKYRNEEILKMCEYILPFNVKLRWYQKLYFKLFSWRIKHYRRF